MQLLSNTFDNQAIQAITNIQPVPNDQQDVLRWLPSKNGICTTKKKLQALVPETDPTPTARL
jgi:hypothetical protein